MKHFELVKEYTYPSKSCGCKSKIETAYNINKKYNKYEIDNDVVYVNLNNSDENIMICDLEDWNKQKRLLLDKESWWIRNIV